MKTAMMFVLLSVIFSGSVYAQLSARSCQAEIQQYCAKVKAGGGAIAACLEKHQSSLSSTCNQYRQMIKNKVLTFIKECNRDIKTHCATVAPGEGRIYACLKKHEAALSTTCKNQMRLATKQ